MPKTEPFLEACPGCGSEDLILNEALRAPGSPTRFYFVSCADCGHEGSRSTSKTTAIRVWNDAEN